MKADISTYRANMSISGDFFILIEKELGTKKNGETFLKLVLGDGTLSIKAVMWENIGSIEKELTKMAVVKVQGIIQTYQSELQMKVQRIRAATEEEINFEDFYPLSREDKAAFLEYFNETIASLTEPFIVNLLKKIFADQDLIPRLENAPAAKKIHHNVPGGLLEHTVAVTKICDQMTRLYPVLNRDLLLAGALLHDIGKIYEFSNTTFDYTDEGRLLGHLFLGTSIIQEHGRDLIVHENDRKVMMELLHIVLSHHGQYEWGSPVVPMTLEAITLHHADNLDAKIYGFNDWLQNNPAPDRENWSKYWKFMDRYLYNRPHSPEKDNISGVEENHTDDNSS